MTWSCRRGQRVSNRMESHALETNPMLQQRLRFLVPLIDQTGGSREPPGARGIHTHLVLFFQAALGAEQACPGGTCAGGAQHHQILWCHKVARVSALREKPHLSILGAGWFHLDFLTQEKEEPIIPLSEDCTGPMAPKATPQKPKYHSSGCPRLGLGQQEREGRATILQRPCGKESPCCKARKSPDIPSPALSKTSSPLLESAHDQYPSQRGERALSWPCPSHGAGGLQDQGESVPPKAAPPSRPRCRSQDLEILCPGGHGSRFRARRRRASQGLGARGWEPGAGSQALALPTLPHSPPIYEDAKNSTSKLAFRGLVEWPR
ncbi:hypothetical protein J1605_007202 [Eschrichtius robustus]|uniref:Uncharacterized protein n=1 Tax=Eschrichtius robustus TaxID=9764 RepID=A0AB34H3X8_ESCRO|nr:hypothetical protein J1605_007202 [Eschrichtius robustus]